MISLRTHKPEMPAHFCHLIFQLYVCSVIWEVFARKSADIHESSLLLLNSLYITPSPGGGALLAAVAITSRLHLLSG